MDISSHFLMVWYRRIILIRKFQRDSFNGGAEYKGMGKMQFLTEIAVYVGNATRHANSYNGSLIGSHRSDCFNDDLELP